MIRTLLDADASIKSVSGNRKFIRHGFAWITKGTSAYPCKSASSVL